MRDIVELIEVDNDDGGSPTVSGERAELFGQSYKVQT